MATPVSSPRLDHIASPSDPEAEIISAAVAAALIERGVPCKGLAAQPNSILAFVFGNTPEFRAALAAYLDNTLVLPARSYSRTVNRLRSAIKAAQTGGKAVSL